jgi:hypothetical protein
VPPDEDFICLQQSPFINPVDSTELVDVECQRTSVIRGIISSSTDTPDSVLSSADTFSSYSGSSAGGVGEIFSNSFGGLPEDGGVPGVGIDDERDDEDNDADSAIHVNGVDDGSSFSGSLASGGHDHCDDGDGSVGNCSADIRVDIVDCDSNRLDDPVTLSDSISQKSDLGPSHKTQAHRHHQVSRTSDGKASTLHSVKSTTALILEDRPSGLPMKSQDEERKHRKLYEALVKNAKHKERKAEEQHRKQLEKQWKHEEAISSYLQIWNKEILPAWDQMRNTKRTRDMWWLGLPPSIRGKVWKLVIANDLNITSELYEICLVRATERLRMMKDPDTDSLASFSESSASRESSVDVIRLDVSRTFPHLGIFQKGGPYHDLLQGLLGAYACYRPDVGYVQGMSFIAAVLLLNMEVNDAFVCFANLLNRPCQVAFFRLDESLMKAYFDTYEEFFQENLTKLYRHFVHHHLTPDLYLIDWIFTLYAKSLSLDVTSRVWDVFFRDGEEFLFRTAIGILKLYEDILLEMDFIQLAEYLTRLPADLSADELFRSIETVSLFSRKRTFTEALISYSSVR